MADPRTTLIEAARIIGLDLAKLSRQIERNQTYLQQYVQYGKPKRLRDVDRVRLARLLKIDERDLMEAGDRRVLGGAQPSALPADAAAEVAKLKAEMALLLADMMPAGRPLTHQERTAVLSAANAFFDDAAERISKLASKTAKP